MHDDQYVCPLAAVDQRLDDVHQAWHDAETAYFDPQRFRVAVQTSIQTLRTVTFVLQNNKRLFADFDGWYGPWRERFRADPLMRWMVEARNKIEKQGDLEAHSFVRAEIVASHLDEGPFLQVPAELWDAPLKLLKSIPTSALGDHVHKDGIMRISRRWVENSLPDFELLEAVARAYGQIALLVADAHRILGLTSPTTINQTVSAIYPKDGTDGRMPCMVGHEDLRTLNIWLADGRPMNLATGSVTIDVTRAKELEAKYALDITQIFPTGEGDEAIIASLFATARTVFLRDGYHITIAMLLRNGRPVDMLQMIPQEHGEKYLMMRRLADEVRKQAADAVIVTSEVWSAPFDPNKPYQRAVDAPDRHEMLLTTLVRKVGEAVQYTAHIAREGDKLALSETEMSHGGAQFAFASVYKAWGKAIPAEWSKFPMGHDAGPRPR